MEAKPIVFLDSNYWIYLFDKTTAEHQYVLEHFKNLYDNAFLEGQNISKLCTHDEAFKKIPNIEIIDPIPNKI